MTFYKGLCGVVVSAVPRYRLAAVLMATVGLFKSAHVTSVAGRN